MDITLKIIRDSYAKFGERTSFNDWEHFSNHYSGGTYLPIIEKRTQEAYDIEIKKQSEYKTLSNEQLLHEITKLRMEFYYNIKTDK